MKKKSHDKTFDLQSDTSKGDINSESWKVYTDSYQYWSGQNIDENNSIKLVILNDQVYTGDKLYGSVQIHIKKYLPKGAIKLAVESVISSRLRQNEFKGKGKQLSDYLEVL